ERGRAVEPEVRAALAPARGVLADLGCQVSDAAPDLSGGDDVFRTWRALRFATAFGPLLRDHPGDIGPNVTWNVERGRELTVADLSRATTLWAGLAERINAFFADFDRHDRPGMHIPPFDVDMSW